MSSVIIPSGPRIRMHVIGINMKKMRAIEVGIHTSSSNVGRPTSLLLVSIFERIYEPSIEDTVDIRIR